MLHAPHHSDYYLSLLVISIVGAGAYFYYNPNPPPSTIIPSSLTLDLTPMQKYCSPDWQKTKRTISTFGITYRIFISENCGKQYKAEKEKKK